MEQERTAAVLMIYFHPHTMRRDLADEHVPYIGALQGPHPTWVSAMQHWFDGRVLCEEVKRYLGNFMAVTRARPDGDPGELNNSDECLSDEELELSALNLAKALETRSATRVPQDDNKDAGEDPARQAERSKAFELAQGIWGNATHTTGEPSETAAWSVSEERLKEIFKSAAASQSKEKAEFAYAQPGGAGSLRQSDSYSTADVRAWLAAVRRRKDKRGLPLVKQAQVQMLQVVVDRLCAELEALGSAATEATPARSKKKQKKA